MKVRKFLGTCFGILIICTGIYCIFNPALTYMNLGYVVGVSMLFDAIAQIGTWWEFRETKESTVWYLVGGLISLASALIIITDLNAQYAVDMFIAYVAAFWIVVRGIMSVYLGTKTYKVHKMTMVAGKNWWLRCLTGVLMIIFGILSFSNPTALITSIGLFIGCGIISTGVDVMFASSVSYLLAPANKM